MRKLAVVSMAALMAVAGLTVGADARPTAPQLRLPALAPAPNDALTRALTEGRISDSEYALKRAASLSRLGAVRREFGSVGRPGARAATLILRDLALRVSSLSGAERAEAEALLARPNQGGPNDGTLEYETAEALAIESPNFRIHYVTSTDDKSTPAYAATISALMEEVWTKEVTEFGWRQPKSDANATPNGGDGKFDVYLGDVGGLGYYGYCATDGGQTTLEQYSYCVLDNDYTGFDLPVLDAARVTAAHEFSHAIHFTYDVTDDYWFLEATGTWMEDEVYDDINDNYQYLSASSLSRPQTPADSFVGFDNPANPNTGFQYGQFIWMRYLSEKFGSRDLVRNIWENTAVGGSYSLKAIEATLAGKGTDFASSYADFAARNTKPSRFYEEGAAYEAKVAPVRHKTHTLTGTTPGKGSFSDVDHLTSRAISFKPGAGVVQTDQITLSVDLGSNPMQRASVVNLAGTGMTVTEVPLVGGKGNLTVPFGGQTEVVLVLTNASNRMINCDPRGGAPGDSSCGGNPVDDNQSFAYAGVIGTTPVDPGGGTTPPPTGGPAVTNLKAVPSVISPNGDGRKDKTRISFILGDNASVTGELYKGTRRIGYFFEDIVREEGPGHFFTWNGKVGTRVVKNGVYTVKITATNTTGTTEASTNVTVRR